MLEFSVLPVGVGEGIGNRIARVVDLVDRSGLPYKAHSIAFVGGPVNGQHKGPFSHDGKLGS